MAAATDPSFRPSGLLMTTVEISSPSGGNANKFTQKLDKPIQNVVRAELVSVGIYGTPVTAGVPDNNYLALQIDEFSFNTVSTENMVGRYKVLLTGITTVEHPRDAVIGDYNTPFELHSVNVSLRKPDGSQAATTDVTGVHFKIRLYYNLYAGRFSGNTNIWQRS